MRAGKRSGMPSIVQAPSPRNALSSARLRTSPGSRLGHRDPGSRRLVHRRRTPCGMPPVAEVPVHAPRCQRETRFSGPRRRLPICNLKRRAGTPCERSFLAREWGFRPATRRHQPMPVALAAPPRCRAGGLRAAPHHTTAFTIVPRLRGTAGCGPERSSEGEPRVLGRYRACPSRDAPGIRVTGSGPMRSLEDSARHRSGRGLPRMPPREGKHRREDRDAFCRVKTLTRAEDGSSVRARADAPSRRLRGGIALGTNRASFLLPRRLLL